MSFSKMNNEDQITSASENEIGNNIEPCDFPNCISCNSNYDVDFDEINEKFVCRKCGIEWE
jgi:hypothetical protein